MELRHLRYFLSVAETMNFTRAAAGHYVAQSALSQQISRLEAELGSPLFYRNSRSVTLTEAGAVLLPLAKRIIADAENAKMEMDALTGLQRGTLRLGLLQTPATSIDIIEVMGDFHERHPGIQFQITDGTSTDMAAAVAGEGLDVALVGLGPSEVPAGLQCVELAVTPLVAVVSARSPLAGRSAIGIPELVECGQFIHFQRGSGLRHQVDAAFSRAGVPPLGSFEMGQISDMLRLAARGVGVTIVPATAAATAQADAVPFSAIALTDTQARHPVSVIYDQARLSSAAAAFVAELNLYVSPPPRLAESPRR
jgi:DNA-binding transcriptional LysR family regulator